VLIVAAFTRKKTTNKRSTPKHTVALSPPRGELLRLTRIVAALKIKIKEEEDQHPSTESLSLH